MYLESGKSTLCIDSQLFSMAVLELNFKDLEIVHIKVETSTHVTEMDFITARLAACFCSSRGCAWGSSPGTQLQATVEGSISRAL